MLPPSRKTADSARDSSSVVAARLIPGGPKRRVGSRGGFSLVETLFVLSIVVVIATLAIAAFRGGPDTNKAAWEMVGFIDHAREYAMAQNTYVWIMFNQGQDATTQDRYIAVYAFASRDGSSTPNKSNFVQVGKLMILQNMTLDNLSAYPYGGRPTAGVLQVTGGVTMNVSSIIPVTTIATKYSNPCRVLGITPGGLVEMPKTSSVSFANMAIFKWLEIGLQPMRGEMKVPAGGTAVIQIAGLTGQTRVYRP
jgi:prepilin-type N-terminal cleavage/methylation domain-containing protein